MPFGQWQLVSHLLFSQTLVSQWYLSVRRRVSNLPRKIVPSSSSALLSGPGKHIARMLTRSATTSDPQPDLSITFTIWGVPKAGKKTLFNALRDADIPGTTFDDDRSVPIRSGSFTDDYRQDGWIKIKDRRLRPAEVKSLLTRAREIASKEVAHSPPATDGEL